jgi:hypothetical protein
MSTLGIERLVIYVDENYNEHPAIITRVHNIEDGVVNLWVLVDSITEINPMARFSVRAGNGEPNTWYYG